MQMAHVNEVEFIGRVVGPVEKLKTAKGQPFVKMNVETERFVRSATGQRERIWQTHTVVIREKLAVPVMSEHAVAGVVVRILGELTYTKAGKTEIVVWDYLGQAKLMTMAEVPASGKPATKDQQSAKNTGGLGRMTPQKNNDQEDGGDDNYNGPRFEEEQSNGKSDDLLNGPEFVKANDLDDDIPF
jgi:single-stranded DNA-binding protein